MTGKGMCWTTGPRCAIVASTRCACCHMRSSCQHNQMQRRMHGSDTACSEEAILVGANWADTWLGRVMDAQSGPLPVPRNQVQSSSLLAVTL